MESSPATYQPINCSFYDELEALATTGQPCALFYRTEADSPPVTYRGIIADLFIRDKVEYLRLQDGFELRLDALLAVDDKELRNYG
jgi:Rho-binding antiterminator